MNTDARDRKDLSKAAWQVLGGSGIRIIARIILIAFIARTFGIDDFGRLGETVAVVELAGAFATFGLNKTLLGSLQRDGATSGYRSLGANAMIVCCCASLVAMIALYLVWPLIFAGTPFALRLALLGIPLIATAEIATTATRHYRTVMWDMAVKAIIKPWSFLVLAVALYALIAMPGARFAGLLSSEVILILAYLGSLLLSAIAAILAMRRMNRDQPFSKASWAHAWRLAVGSWPIALNETCVFAFRRIDIIILALVAGPGATGVYYLAQQVGTVVEKTRYLFEPMLAPIIAQSQSLDTVGSHLQRLCLRIFLIQLAIIVIVSIFGEYGLEFMGKGFALGLLVIIIILVGEMFDGSFGLCELPMVFRDPHWPPRTVVLALIIEIALVATLALQYGAVGAAIGFACAMAILAMMRLSLVRHLYGIAILNRRYAMAAMIASAAVAIATLAGR